MIKSSTILNPYSANYSIGVWVYISNYSQNAQIGRFLTYGNAANPQMFSLRMDNNKPFLYCDVAVMDGSTKPYANLQTVQLSTDTDSFPIQKWTYIVVSVSNTFIECYLNGRFVSATKVNNGGIKVIQPAAGEDIEAGPTFRFGAKGTIDDTKRQTRANGCPVFLTGISRWDSPLSAGDIYNNYMKGNGNNSSFAYHMDINLKKDKKNYTLNVF